MTELLSLGQYYSIDCITGPVPTGVSVSWILTNGSIYSYSNTLIIPSILPSHNNTQYTCNMTIIDNPTSCMMQSHSVTVRIKGTKINLPITSVLLQINLLLMQWWMICWFCPKLIEI